MKLIQTRDIQNNPAAINPAAVRQVVANGDDCLVELEGGSTIELPMDPHAFADLVSKTVAQGEADKAASAVRAFAGGVSEMVMQSPIAAPLLMKLIGPQE